MPIFDKLSPDSEFSTLAMDDDDVYRHDSDSDSALSWLSRGLSDSEDSPDTDNSGDESSLQYESSY